MLSHKLRTFAPHYVQWLKSCLCGKEAHFMVWSKWLVRKAFWMMWESHIVIVIEQLYGKFSLKIIVGSKRHKKTIWSKQALRSFLGFEAAVSAAAAAVGAGFPSPMSWGYLFHNHLQNWKQPIYHCKHIVDRQTSLQIVYNYQLDHIRLYKIN